jgi:transcriptional regulator GlxA family with amidase domain
MSIDGLAGDLGMSPRTLIRRFKAATRRLPGAYLQTLRMMLAEYRSSFANMNLDRSALHAGRPATQ